MAGIIAEMFGTTTDAPANPTIAASLVSGSAGMAAAYLTATLEATTPEVRRLYSEYLSQSILGNDAIKKLTVKKGWASPYDNPEQQVKLASKAAQSVLS